MKMNRLHMTPIDRYPGQGFKNSPFWMNALMSQVIMDCKNCISFADDIFVTNKGTLDQHLEELEKLLSALVKAKLKIKPSKISILTETLEVLGFEFKNDKFSIPKASAQAINAIQLPTKKSKVLSFTARCNFFRLWVKNFSEISRPLTALTHKSVDHRRFKMTPEGEEAFKTLKRKIMSSGFLNGPLKKRTFIAYSDASTHCCSFVLYQKNEESQPDCVLGREEEYRMMGAHSRQLIKSEVGASIFKKEVCEGSLLIVELAIILM